MRETFLKYLQYEKRYSKHTITSYDNDLSQFDTFLSSNFSHYTLSSAEHSTIRSWIVSLVDKGLDSRSINRKIACLRSFYKFILRREVIDHDPTQNIRLLKTSRKLPNFVHEDEVMKLLDQSPFEDTFHGARDRLILELLYGTGIRLSELLALKSSDINFENRVIKVLGKRNKERIIPFSVGLGKVIGQYLAQKNNQVQINDVGVLLVTDKGEACYPMVIYRIVKKYLNLFTTIEKRSPHVLRHTFATHLLNKGAELNAVKELLGHTSLAATQVYTHNSLDKLKKVFDQAHPKA